MSGESGTLRSLLAGTSLQGRVQAKSGTIAGTKNYAGYIYSPTHGANDYTDDYRDRGLWVNYLAGGTKACPDVKGLNIPIDLSLAFHTDAGTVRGDSIIGNLGIYQVSQYGGKFADGTSRVTHQSATK